MNFNNIITIEPGKKGGKPCIRGMRISVEDILRWLASGMTVDEIVRDFPELNPQDIYAALEFAANQQSKNYFAA